MIKSYFINLTTVFGWWVFGTEIYLVLCFLYGMVIFFIELIGYSSVRGLNY